MDKALAQINVQLHKAGCDVTGQAGMRILRAIVARERDVHALARLHGRRVQATEERWPGPSSGTRATRNPPSRRIPFA